MADLTFPLDIPDVTILETEINQHGDYIITVESIWQSTQCRKCKREISQFHGYDQEITVRHLSILGRRVYIKLQPKRYRCPYCDGKPTTTQQLDWYNARSGQTIAYEKHLLLQLVNSTMRDVSRKEGIGYDAVVGVLNRYIDAEIDWDNLDELGTIGIDEIALHKGRNSYVAVITSQQTNGQVTLLAGLPDRKKATVRAFFDGIPARLRPTIHSVCTDMWEAYTNAAQDYAAAHADVTLDVVVDRFHVARNYRNAVDQLRKRVCRDLKKTLPKADYEDIKQVMWACRKNHANLTAEERPKLLRLFELAPDFKLAYTLREELTAIFDLPLSKDQAVHRLRKWQTKVEHSGLTCFDAFLKTLTNWFDEITNYFARRLTSSFVEGFNNRLKTLKRRCYGLGIGHLFRRLRLDLSGYTRFAGTHIQE
jgi:transposase